MMSLYGRPKTGKTRLAATFPKPLLIIGAEDGTASIIGTRDVYFVRLRNCSEFVDLVNGPVKMGKYKTVVIDNGSKMRDMRISEILGLEEVPVQKGYGFATREQWGECSNSLKAIWRPLFDLGKVRALNIIMIAQEQNYKDEDGGAASELLTPNIGPGLGKSCKDWVNAECDYIGQTLVREQSTTRKTQIKVNNKMVPKTITTLTGKKEYCLRVGAHEIFEAGFRVPLGRELPDDFIVNPTYDKIISIING
jgi:hypothetical protein